jgi:hypothetical protein
VAPARVTFQARFLSEKAIPNGTKGRKMPVDASRETAEATKMPATLTIQVCYSLQAITMSWPLTDYGYREGLFFKAQRSAPMPT